MTQELKWYDQLYSEGGDWSSFVEEDTAYMLELALSNLKKKIEVTVLDVGCGAGGFLARARKRGIEKLVGTDISPSALLRAKANLKAAEFVVADGQYLPFIESAFDVVACVGTLEHFKDPKRGAEQMYRVLERRGTCLVVLPNPYYAYTLLCKLLRKYRYQPIEHDLTASGWKRCFKSAGFCVRKTAPANPRSDSILNAKSIPRLGQLYLAMLPLFRLYDRVRRSLPQISSYHVIFMLKREN